MKYDMYLHSEALLTMLEELKDPPLMHCPWDVAAGMLNRWGIDEDTLQNSNDTCKTCWEFLDPVNPWVSTMKYPEIVRSNCPCIEMGLGETVKLTWLALEDRGFV